MTGFYTEGFQYRNSIICIIEDEVKELSYYQNIRYHVIFVIKMGMFMKKHNFVVNKNMVKTSVGPE